MVTASIILATVLFVLFLWSLIIARDPREWRQAFQAVFEDDNASVNRNKLLDEAIRRWCRRLAGTFLVFSLTVLALGLVLHLQDKNQVNLTPEQRAKLEQLREIERIEKEEELRQRQP
jgi:uncharacterized protein YjeT (DUF2065 family)